jgi:hypothetical protein
LWAWRRQCRARRCGRRRVPTVRIDPIVGEKMVGLWGPRRDPARRLPGHEPIVDPVRAGRRERGIRIKRHRITGLCWS